MKYKRIPVTVRRQGAPEFGDKCATVYRGGQRVVALVLDLNSKYCEVEYIGADGAIPVIGIGATKRSMFLLAGQRRTESTEIVFHTFKNWSVWCAHVSKYTLAVCLVKEG